MTAPSKSLRLTSETVLVSALDGMNLEGQGTHRRLPAAEAAWLFSAAFKRDPGAARAFLRGQSLLDQTLIRSMNDTRLGPLVVEAIERRRLIAVRVAGPGETRADDPVSRTLHTLRGPLTIEGRSYELVAASAVKDRMSQGSLAVVRLEEASTVLQKLAAVPGTPPQKKEALTSAAGLLVPLTPVGGQRDGIVLLRYEPGRTAAPPSDAPALTPSALKKLATPLSWVGVMVVDEDDVPVPGVLVRVSAPGGIERDLVTNEHGMIELAEIPDGSVKVQLPEHDASAWNGGA